MYFSLSTSADGFVEVNSHGRETGRMLVVGHFKSDDREFFIVHESGSSYWASRGEQGYSGAKFTIYEVTDVLWPKKKYKVLAVTSFESQWKNRAKTFARRWTGHE